MGPNLLTVKNDFTVLFEIEKKGNLFRVFHFRGLLYNRNFGQMTVAGLFSQYFDIFFCDRVDKYS